MPKPDKGLSKRQVRQRVRQADQKARNRGATRKDIKALHQAHGAKKNGCAVVGITLAGLAAARMSGQI